MKSMISLGIDTAYEFPTYLNFTLKLFFLSVWKSSYSFKSCGWVIWFLHLSQASALSWKPFFISVAGCIFLLQFLQRIVFSKMSVRTQGFLPTSFELV